MKKIFLLIIFTAFLSSFVFAEMDVPAKLQAALLFKVFGFNKTLTEASGTELTLGIFYVAGNSESESAKNDMKTEIQTLASNPINGKTIVVKEITSVNEIAGLNIVYITPGADSVIDSIISACNSNKVLGSTGVENYAQKGLALAIGLADGKPKIIINKSASEGCGAQFSSQVMSLAKVI